MRRGEEMEYGQSRYERDPREAFQCGGGTIEWGRMRRHQEGKLRSFLTWRIKMHRMAPIEGNKVLGYRRLNAIAELEWESYLVRRPDIFSFVSRSRI